MTALRSMTAGLAMIAAGSIDAAAQGSVRIDLPRDDPFPAAPEISVHAVDFSDNAGLLRVRLRLALDQNFGLLLLDSIVAGRDARFVTKRLLPENRDIFAEGSVINQAGITVVTQTTRAGRTGNRLTLLTPNGRTGVTIQSRHPRFAWRSAPVTFPPGPWVYELSITNVATQEIRSQPNIVDTTFITPDSLQSNSSYRWKVVARLAGGLASDSAVASSESSFIIAPTDAPVTTLLYQNFPNPFPAASSPTTCFWFDLQKSSHVDLAILDVRGNRVKTLVPGQLPADLPSGRYGRLRDVDASGCDPRLAWDGTSDNGRTVSPGVYLVRLKTDNGIENYKKVLFLGR